VACTTQARPAPTLAPSLLGEDILRGLLTQHGLTARGCDLIVLDLQGRTRKQIATTYRNV
jgi:hypothetical protein